MSFRHRLRRPTQPWHSLRHAFCTTLAAAAGVEVSVIRELAGHKSVETTMSIVKGTNRFDPASTLQLYRTVSKRSVAALYPQIFDSCGYATKVSTPTYFMWIPWRQTASNSSFVTAEP
jgi:hypothetical protein